MRSSVLALSLVVVGCGSKPPEHVFSIHHDHRLGHVLVRANVQTGAVEYKVARADIELSIEDAKRIKATLIGDDPEFHRERIEAMEAALDKEWITADDFSYLEGDDELLRSLEKIALLTEKITLMIPNRFDE